MIFWRRRAARSLPPEKRVNPRPVELQASKEVLTEVFHDRPEDIEDMIQSRLEERRWVMGQAPTCGELWHEAFCLGE